MVTEMTPHPTLAPAGLARIGDYLTGAPTHIAGSYLLDCAEECPCESADLSRALALGAGLARGSRGYAGPGTGVASDHAIDFDLLLHTGGYFFECKFYANTKILAAIGATASTTAKNSSKIPPPPRRRRSHA